MSRQVNSESILPNDISPSLTNSTDISNNNNINNNNNNTSSNDNNNDSSKANSNNNQNTSNYNGNDNQQRKMPEVVVNGPTTKKDDYDIDDEVMGFMHAYIQSSSSNDEVDNKSSTKNKPDSSPTDGPSSSSYNQMNDNMPSWDAPLMSARDSALAPDDYNEALNGRISRHSECSIEADLLTERENMLEEEDASELAKRLESELTGTILALWQERLTQKSTTEADIEIEYASESDIGSTGPPSPTGFSSTGIPPPVQFADNNAKVNSRLNQIRNSNPVHPMAPVKLPMPPSDGSGNNNNALEEIRSRLRKTKFDYSSDSRQRISDATPQLDYRAVLKKKGKV